MDLKKGSNIFGLVRIGLGLTFLWAFIDKVFGFGFATVSDKSWINGGSPTAGFLANAVHGPFAGLFNSLSGMVIIDWLFMLGLLGIGIGLTFGIAMKLSTGSGVVLFTLMWLSLLPPPNHPFIDDHVIYGLVLIGLNYIGAGRYFGFGNSWNKIGIVKKYKWLM